MKDIAPCNQEDTILYTAIQHLRLVHLWRFFVGRLPIGTACSTLPMSISFRIPNQTQWSSSILCSITLPYAFLAFPGEQVVIYLPIHQKRGIRGQKGDTIWDTGPIRDRESRAIGLSTHKRSSEREWRFVSFGRRKKLWFTGELSSTIEDGKRIVI
jgi:hypothetical protein